MDYEDWERVSWLRIRYDVWILWTQQLECKDFLDEVSKYSLLSIVNFTGRKRMFMKVNWDASLKNDMLCTIPDVAYTDL
jgi:hypothetical protein